MTMNFHLLYTMCNFCHPCSYVLTIIARDRADEPRSSNATISVTVRDENDNPPVILNITSGLTVVSIEEVETV